MSIQNISSSSAALSSSFLQFADSSNNSSSSDLQGLPQLSSDQLQQLRQALQQDLRQAFSSASSAGGNGQGNTTNASGVQSQLDQSISDTLGQFGFTDAQKQTVLDKINQALTGGDGTSGKRGHGRHHVHQALNSIFQVLQSASGSQSVSNSTAGGASTPTSASSVVGAGANSPGQTLDVTA
jgi:hypothetical protein